MSKRLHYSGVERDWIEPTEALRQRLSHSGGFEGVNAFEATTVQVSG
jgi:hypothetical protein